MMRGRFMRASWCAIALTLTACGGPRLAMRDAAVTTLTAPPEGRARIVLVAPSWQRDVVSLVDERGRYLGQLGARTWTTLDVAPGPHRFYALVGADAYVVEGPVEAGRTYWIVAEHDVLRGMRWIAWEPRCGPEEASRLSDARAIEVDPAADEAAVRHRLGDIPQRILEADRELEAMPDVDRALRHLVAACPPAAVAP